MARGRATLADVAGAAGVSVATVSKVLNDHADVAPETRRRVQQELREASYVQVGRGSRRGTRSEQVIEVSAPELQNAYVVGVLDGLADAAVAEGFQIVLGPRVRRGRIDRDLQSLRRSGRVGAVFITADPQTDPVRHLIDDGFPVVVIDPVHVGGTDCITIGATNFTGGKTATEHLIGLGHRRIAHAGGPVDTDCSHARLAGFSSALRQAGIESDDSMITHGLFDFDAGRAAAAQLLDRPEPPTAIFATCDEIALGIMEEARRRSIRIPDDLSVVGFDDNFLASRSAPPLTTVAQPLLEMGHLAARSLAQVIKNDMIGTRHIELATHLVVRDSTAPPPVRA